MKNKYSLARTASRALITEHSVLRSAPSLLFILMLHVLIWLTAALVDSYFHWMLILPAILIVSVLQHHLLTFMHEGAHYLVHPDRKWNDRITQALCAIPMGSQLKDYRFLHLSHHRHSGDPELDPEVNFYKEAQIGYGLNQKRFSQTLINDLLGINTVRSLLFFAKYFKEKTQEGKIRGLKLWDFKWGFIGLAFMLSVPMIMGFTKIYLLLWGVSFLTLTPVLVRWHAIGEHTGAQSELEQDKTLTHDFPFLVNLALYPIKSHYHLEHHLFPQIPWYEMEAFRQKLLLDPDYLKESQKLTVDGFFWGKSTVKKLVLTP